MRERERGRGRGAGGGGGGGGGGVGQRGFGGRRVEGRCKTNKGAGEVDYDKLGAGSWGKKAVRVEVLWCLKSLALEEDPGRDGFVAHFAGSRALKAEDPEASICLHDCVAPRDSGRSPESTLPRFTLSLLEGSWVVLPGL